MTLENQNNLVKTEITKLYEMLGNKINEMKKMNVVNSDVLRLITQQFEVKQILINYFDYYNMGNNKEIEIACKMGDKY